MPINLRKRKGSAKWYFRRRIPEDVKAHYGGRAYVEESTGTADLREAERYRNRRLAELDAEWEALRHQHGMSVEAVRARAAIDPPWLSPSLPKKTPEQVAAMNLRRDMDEQTEEGRVIAEIERFAERQGLRDELTGDYELSEVRKHPEGARLLSLLPVARGARSWVDAGDEYLQAAHLKPKTKTLYRRQFKQADKLLPAPGHVSRAEARKVLSDMARDKAETTVTNFAIPLRELYKYLRDGDEDRADLDPQIFSLSGLKFKPKIKRRAFRKDELETLLDGMEGKLRLATRIALYTGMRAGEICAAEVSPDWSYFTIDPDLAKTEASARRVPIHPHIAEDVKAWKASSWSASRLTTAFSDWKKDKGFGRELVFHSIRHSVNTRLKKLGFGLEDRSALLGHENKENENITYLHLELEDVIPMVHKLDWSDVFPDH